MQENPTDNLIYNEHYDGSWGGVFRLLADATIGERYSFSANILEVVRSVTFSGFTTTPAIQVERNSLFIRNQHDSVNTTASIELDNFFFKLQTDKVDLTVGRQPINLATTFYFTPNDFFAPFLAQDFYRVYKPGVDSLRAEIKLGQLTQLSLIGALGYTPDPTTDNGWSNGPDWDRSSFVGRFVTSAFGFEWALLGGHIIDATVIGGSIQGEILDWLGVRAEGHYGSPRNDLHDKYTELVVGIEHRFESSLDLHVEYFYHGRGFNDIASAVMAAAASSTSLSYLGKNYTAFSMGYEFTPLFSGQLLCTRNWTDKSRVLSGNGVYSLSDESELVATISVPIGDEPEILTIKSEYGTLPKTISVEYRLYF